MKRIIVVTLLLGLAACSSAAPIQTADATSSWDNLSYVNPTQAHNWGVMKALEQPGIY